MKSNETLFHDLLGIGNDSSNLGVFCYQLCFIGKWDRSLYIPPHLPTYVANNTPTSEGHQLRLGTQYISCLLQASWLVFKIEIKFRHEFLSSGLFRGKFWLNKEMDDSHIICIHYELRSQQVMPSHLQIVNHSEKLFLLCSIPLLCLKNLTALIWHRVDLLQKHPSQGKVWCVSLNLQGLANIW